MEEQLKKLSDLKDNEYVYCLNDIEQKRISGNSGIYSLINNKGKGMAFQEAFGSNDVTMVYDSKAIADYEPPVPVRPSGIDYSNKVQLEWVNYAGDLNIYIDHLEKELEEVKSKAFIPFKVKANKGFEGVSINNVYNIIGIHGNCYIFYNDIGNLDEVNCRHFTKID